MNRFSAIKGEFVPLFTLSSTQAACKRTLIFPSKQASSIFHVSKQASKHMASYQASKRVTAKHGACLLVDITERQTLGVGCRIFLTILVIHASGLFRQPVAYRQPPEIPKLTPRLAAPWG